MYSRTLAQLAQKAYVMLAAFYSTSRCKSVVIALAIISLSLAFTPNSAKAQKLASAQNQTQLTRAEIEFVATREAQKRVDLQKRIDGQGQHVTVIAKLDESGEILILNFSIEYLPANAYDNSEFQDLMGEVSSSVLFPLRDRSNVAGVRFLFSGQSLDDLFPAERARDEELRNRAPRKRGDANSKAGAVVVVGAGHGIYYHYGYKDWRPQRDPFNGITEDYLTPEYASELSTWLISRSSASVMLARSTDTVNYKPSGEPWWKMGAKYYLKEIYPDNPEIWDSLGKPTYGLHDRDEDIRSRPLFANHVSAGTAIHVHSDGLPGSSATGANTWYHTGRSSDEKLANNILCYMAELIHAKEGYEEYVVAKKAQTRTTIGELSLAKMPSVVVESGFHTNPRDAAALKDPVFRAAAMKGVEKGYRLVNETEPCELFKIDRIPDSSGLQNTPIPVKVFYKGYPQFAVTLTVDIVTCPSGWTCTGGTITYPDKVPSPLTYTFTCTTTLPLPPATFRLRTTLKDLDDVKPKPVEHNVTCSPASDAKGAERTSGQPTFTINAQ
jgi:N-acetylmuramoyl-L-alanine amidase